jgi:membrane protease YdiL (CAAX protease family)
MPALIAEFLVLFVVLPLAYRLSPWPVPALPVLWIVTLYCYWQLRRDPTFPASHLWNLQPLASQLGSIMILFLIGASLLYAGVKLFAPELLFSFVRTRPVLWAAVMVLYPVLSVYPQGVIYRSFLMHRYTTLFPSQWALILVSAIAFAWLHIIFRNPLAVGLTFAGGLLFAWRYEATGSLLTSSVEHALYGCWLFTLGLGQYFYHGRNRLNPH